MLEIRKATLDDRIDVMVLIALMHSESPRFSKFPFQVEKAAQLFDTLVERGVVLVAQKDDELVGFFAGGITEHLLSYEHYAADMGVYVRRDQRGGSAFMRLIKASEQWVKDQGVNEIVIGTSTEINAEQTVRMYERLGYRISSYGLIKAGA